MMNPLWPIYLRWFPELARFADRADQKLRFEQAYRHVSRTHGFGAYAWVATGVAVVVVVVFLRSWLPSTRLEFLLALMGAFAGGAALKWIGLWLFRERIRRRLREVLVDRGELICEECGYDTRGLTSRRCPECGAELPVRGTSEGAGE